MGIVECRLFLVAAVAVARLAFCGRDENPTEAFCQRKRRTRASSFAFSDAGESAG
jgi:hypothetical protein